MIYGDPVDELTASPRPRCACAVLLATAIVSFCLGYVVTRSAPSIAYSWQHDMISDLGRASCRTWQGHWVCSPRAHWFDAAIAVTGVCLVAAAALVRDAWGRALRLAVTSLGVGLVWLAVFPSDGPLPLHMVGAVLALPVPAAGLFVSGLRPETPWLAGHRAVRLGLGLVGLVLCLDHLAPAPAPVPRGAAETVTVALLLVALSLEAVRCWRAGSCARDRLRRGDADAERPLTHRDV